jgi:hypothetical protein
MRLRFRDQRRQLSWIHDPGPASCGDTIFVYQYGRHFAYIQICENGWMFFRINTCHNEIWICGQALLNNCHQHFAVRAEILKDQQQAVAAAGETAEIVCSNI